MERATPCVVVASWPLIMLNVRRSTAIALSLGLFVSCGRKPLGSPSLPFDAEGLQTLISKLRHSDQPLAAKLAEKAYRAPNPTIPTSWQWRFRLLHAELLLDRANGSDVPITKISELLSFPIPAGVSSAEAAARIASVHGYVAQVQFHWQAAEKFYEEASAALSEVNDPCWRAELLVHHRAQTLRHMARHADVDVLLRQAGADTKRCPDRYWEALAPFVEGNSFNDQFYYENAVAGFERSRALATLYRIPQLIANSLGNMALCYYNLGDWDNALRTFDRTDEFYKNLAQPSGKELRDWGTHKAHRARTYLARRQYDDAARSYKQAIDIATQTGDEPSLARWRAELTSLYIEVGDYQSAKALNQRALDDADFESEFPQAAAAWLNAARLARLEGELPAAQEELAGVQKEFDKYPSERDPKLIWQMHSERAQVLAGMNRVHGVPKHREERAR